MHGKSNTEKLKGFQMELSTFKEDLNLLLTHQAVLITSANTTTLKGIEDKISKMYLFFAELKDEQEAIAEEFVSRNGGEEAIEKVSTLLSLIPHAY